MCKLPNPFVVPPYTGLAGGAPADFSAVTRYSAAVTADAVGDTELAIAHLGPVVLFSQYKASPVFAAFCTMIPPSIVELDPDYNKIN